MGTSNGISWTGWRPCRSKPCAGNIVGMGDVMVKRVFSPNEGPTRQRQRLASRFSAKVSINPAFTRRTVSYQGNKAVPGFRWMKYKEGFSQELVSRLLDYSQPMAVLDPFAGLGTTPIVAAGRGKQAMGIELMPVGVLLGSGIVCAANGVSCQAVEQAGQALLNHVTSSRRAADQFTFPHVRITERAFPESTEQALAKARQFVADVKPPAIRSLLNLACLSVLEDVSYTRKDGQYLRWDFRSGRPLRAKIDKGRIVPFHEAFQARLAEMVEDIDDLKALYGNGRPNLIAGSCLERLREIPGRTFDMVITSPPYANRYDYTRTYALELAWLGFDNHALARLRQDLLSSTVENKTKRDWLARVYGRKQDLLAHAQRIYAKQQALHEVLGILRSHASELSNKQIIRMLEGYFLEMSLIIAELGRIVRPSGSVIMVNDNVQYHGEEIPVDFILSDFAEQAGFICTDIWLLPTGKGNSSQQMAKFGRHELRKCVYRWVRKNE